MIRDVIREKKRDMIKPNGYDTNTKATRKNWAHIIGIKVKTRQCSFSSGKCCAFTSNENN